MQRKKWDIGHVNKLKNKGLKVSGDEGYKKPEPLGKQFIEKVLIESGLSFEKEYKFFELRNWRSDFFIIDKKVIVEYEGIYSEFSRHTHYSGFVGDCHKYNKASILGYRLLRYTSGTYKDFENDIKLL